ncbi:probable cyclic nucleotide-gated ion channel 20, chloroplastic isoform X2 [Tanacetum coccineum]
MDGTEKDDMPMLSVTDWPSDRHESNKKRRFKTENRSVSISIPVSSTELNSRAPNHIGFAGPLPSDRISPAEPVEQDQGKIRKHQETDDGKEAKNEHLLRSGQLGICNDPYCTTCPTPYSYKGQLLISRVSQGLDHSFRLAFISPESRVVGAGDLVDNPRKIALHYLSGFFPLDLFIVLPLPQIIVLLILPNSIASSGANYAKNLLRSAVLLQYIPRLYRFLPLLAGQSPSGFTFESAWANFVINLLTFVLAGHVVGSCWYLFGLQVCDIHTL